MQASDLFCLSGHWERLGSSAIVAAAWGAPALVSRIYRLSDTMYEEELGTLNKIGKSHSNFFERFIQFGSRVSILVEY